MTTNSDMELCHICGGNGTVRTTTPAGLVTGVATCEACDGLGTVPTIHESYRRLREAAEAVRKEWHNPDGHSDEVLDDLINALAEELRKP